MNIHWKIRTWHLDISLHQRQAVLGVNSILPDNQHLIMWDFDKQSYYLVLLELKRQQEDYGLSTIYIARSSVPGNYHAYCLSRVTWATLIYILQTTEGIDQQYIKLGVMRGYMTLRFTDKKDSQISALTKLISCTAPDIEWAELTNFERYFTLTRKHHDKSK